MKLNSCQYLILRILYKKENPLTKFQIIKGSWGLAFYNIEKDLNYLNDYLFISIDDGFLEKKDYKYIIFPEGVEYVESILKTKDKR